MQMSTLSFLQNASAAQSLVLQANILAMKQNELKHSAASLAPSAMPSDSNVYGGFFGESQMNMLSPQMFAADQTAALLAAHLNLSASNFYQSPMFPWQMPPLTTPPMDNPMLNMTNLNTTENRHIDIEMNESESNSEKLASSKQIKYQPYSMDSSSSGSISPPSSVEKSPSSKDKTFVCQTCNKSFGYKHVLRNHERTHTGEKPFQCTFHGCGKRFTRDHHLKTHMRLHTGEKPYICPYEGCGRRFVQVANKRRHMRVHSNGKSDVSVINEQTSHIESSWDLSAQKTQPQFTVNHTVVQPVQQRGAENEMPLDLSVESGSEQNEPEDLSMHSSRSGTPSEELDVLDETESINYLSKKC